MYKIMLVEDDPAIAQALCRHLEKWDYQVATIGDFKNVTEQIVAASPHLVLMDIMLPYFNGFHWCAALRQVSKVPVIFLSSASDNLNIVMAMNMGGDDFVQKPFDVNVLTAKIGALLRRAYDFKADMNVLTRGEVMLNLADNTLTCHDQRVELTRNEYRILRLLMEQAGQTVSRDSLMEALWEDGSFIDDNTLTVNVTRLRKKLEGAGVMDFIATKKGMGYAVP